MEWLKASAERKTHDEYQWRNKQQKFDDNGEGRDEYLDLFQNETRIRAMQEF